MSGEHENFFDAQELVQQFQHSKDKSEKIEAIENEIKYTII
mgnify:CR=1 FL=1